MPRVATKFDNHQQFGTFAQDVVTSDSLTSENVSVVASDKESQRSGEVTATIYALADNAENPIDGALALFGGSPVELAKFAITAYNDDVRTRAKAFIADSILGPEKTMARTIKRIAKALGLDEDAVAKKVKNNPDYLEMFLSLAKKD